MRASLLCLLLTACSDPGLPYSYTTPRGLAVEATHPVSEASLVELDYRHEALRACLPPQAHCRYDEPTIELYGTGKRFTLPDGRTVAGACDMRGTVQLPGGFLNAAEHEFGHHYTCDPNHAPDSFVMRCEHASKKAKP